MTLCPNCGSCIAEEDLECGCWTCGFSVNDIKMVKEVNDTIADVEKEIKPMQSEFAVSVLSDAKTKAQYAK